MVGLITIDAAQFFFFAASADNYAGVLYAIIYYIYNRDMIYESVGCGY